MKLFITGTDTNVGKTHISVGLLNFFNQQGMRTLGIKPIAAGCDDRFGKLFNADALQLQAASSIKLPYAMINPFAFLPAIAPHLAAIAVEERLTVKRVMRATRQALSYPADVYVIEGAGGWYVPLNHHETLADYVCQSGFNTILVVGMRLGCLNHALLTLKAMGAQGVTVRGWVANCLEQPAMPWLAENVAALKSCLDAPCLGVVQHGQCFLPDEADDYLKLS